MTNNDEINNSDDYTHIDELDEKLMDHDYDGIKELDNPAPAWIMAIFYITIFIAVMYGAYYFWFDQGLNQEQEYALENKEYAEKYASKISNEPLALLTDKASIAEGQAIFAKQCIACHGIKGEGGIGANLTDNTWIHGCDFDAVNKIINDGAPNGMPGYKAQMSGKNVQQVVSYILIELKDKGISGKASEGEVCK